MIVVFTFVQVFIKRTMERNTAFKENKISQIEYTPEFYE